MYDKKQQEIPERKDSYRTPSEKSPNKIPDAEPGRNNPVNPKSDEVKFI